MIIPPIRQTDDYGDGAYLSSRVDHVHRGVDFSVCSNSILTSVVNGRIIRFVQPYSKYGPKGFYKGIQIKVDEQTFIKIMYINPLVNVGDRIQISDPIGIVQDLTIAYPGMKQDGVTIKRPITNHIHFEVWVEGGHVDPIQWLKNYKECL